MRVLLERLIGILSQLSDWHVPAEIYKTIAQISGILFNVVLPAENSKKVANVPTTTWATASTGAQDGCRYGGMRAV